MAFVQEQAAATVCRDVDPLTSVLLVRRAVEADCVVTESTHTYLAAADHRYRETVLR